MIKVFLGILGLMLLIQCPILVLVILAIVIAVHTYKPRSFPSNRATRSSSLGTGDSGTSGDKGFVTMKERQDKWVKELIRPDWDPWSPENRERTKALHEIMDRNKKIAQREMADRILQEKAQKARREELGQS